jgi:hypothetical protein
MLSLPTTVAAIRAELDSGNPRGYLALSHLMDFDSPITVHEDGTVTHGPANVYAPDLTDDELSGEGWELFTHGYSGQHGYSGPIMHDSEFIGGGLARDILGQPGTYVAVVAYWPPSCEHCDAEIYQDAQGAWIDVQTGGDACPAEPAGNVHESEGSDSEGWAIAKLTA